MGSKQHELNWDNNSNQIEAKIVQTTLDKMCKTLLTKPVEDLEYISNIMHASKSSTNNKTQYSKRKGKKVEIIKQGVLKETLPYMVVDSG